MGNISVSLWGAVEWLLYAIIVGFLWKSVSNHLAETTVGKAMAYLLS